MVDFSEEHKYGHGFDPEVCQSCPELDRSGMMDSCGLCGCPINGPMNLKDAPPESCVRLDDHYDPDSDESDGGLFGRFFG